MKTERDSRPVFDASAVLALLQGEKGADKLRAVQGTAVVSAVNAAEVLAKLAGHGMPAAEAQAAYDAMHLATLPFEVQDARLSVGYTGRNVSLGDRCFLATAHRYGPGWTSDRALKALTGTGAATLHFFR